MKRNFFIVVSFIFLLTQNAFAYSSDPKQFIQEIVDEAKKILVETNCHHTHVRGAIIYNKNISPRSSPQQSMRYVTKFKNTFVLLVSSMTICDTAEV